METWYEVEYSYNRPGSEKLKYKGLKVCKTREEAEKFAAVVYWLSKKDKGEYDSRQFKVSRKRKVSCFKKDLYMHQKRNKIKNKWEIAGWRYVKNLNH